MPDDDRYTDPATTRLPSPSPRPRPPISGWITDPSEPSGWRWVPDLSDMTQATQMLPVVPAPVGRVDYQGAVDWAWPPDQPTFTRDDGSVYERADPDEFESFDDVDSTTIVDDGAPD